MTAQKENFLTLYKEFAEEITDCPPNYHDYVAITAVGIMLGNQCYLPFGDTRIYPNIWLILLGDSSYSRKTTAMNIGKRLLSEASPERIYPNEFSQERIQALLENRPAGCFFFSEFLTLMGLLQRDYMAGTKSFLADLFDSPFTYRRETQEKTIKIEHPAISIMSATTHSWFTDKLKESDVAGGFLPRFIMVMPCKKTKDISLPPEADKEKRHRLVFELQKFQSISGVAFIKEDARHYFQAWYEKLVKWPGNGRTQPFVNRLQIYTLKFAMILSVINEMSLKISAESMAQAVEYTLRLCKDLTHVEEEELVFGKVQVNMKKILDCLRRHPASSKSYILNTAHLTSRDFKEAMETLHDGERVRREVIKTSGRPVEFYHLTETKKDA